MTVRTAVLVVLSAVLGAVLVTGCGGGDRPAPAPSPLTFVAHTPAPTPARSFTAGSYVVGVDVEAGRYSAGAGVKGCRWLQRDSAGQTIDESGAARPTQVLTLNTVGSELVVAGAGCHFARLP